MDHRIKTSIIILAFLASCQTHKKINKTSLQESRQSSTIENHQHNHQQNERSRDLQAIQSDYDRSTILTFDGAGTITIDGSGTITADGINPRIQHIDRSRSTTTIQADKELSSNSSSQTGRELTEKEESKAKTTDKDITRTNYTPVVLSVAGCLIFLFVVVFLYRKFKP